MITDMAAALTSALPKIFGFGTLALIVWVATGVHERILSARAADRRARRMFAGNRRPDVIGFSMPAGTSPRGEVVRSAPASAAGKRPSDLT